MATAISERVNGSSAVESEDPMERVVEYVPLGEREAIKISVKLVLKWLMPPTRSGKTATQQDAMKFVMLCRARELNPWVGDAYAVGYDSNDGPVFNLITSVQAMFKRAELHEEYDGIESGVIVRGKGPEAAIEYRDGDFYAEDEVLLGGWAKVYRKDCNRPFYEAVKLSTFSKSTAIWKSNPEGMVSKVAEMGALRKAFPNQLGGLYSREEIDAANTIDVQVPPKLVTDMEELTNELKEKKNARKQKAIEHSEKPVNYSEQIKEQHESEVIEPVSKARQVEPERVQHAEVESEEPDIVADYKQQIQTCEDSVELRLLEQAIKKSRSLDDDERAFLLKLSKSRMGTLQ